MKIIEPSANLINPADLCGGIAQLRNIEYMARISHRSEEAQTEDSWEKFVKFVVLEKGDTSIVEHSSATVIFRVDRGITHELVRHRLFSVTQESTRFVNPTSSLGKQIYPDGLEFIAPIESDSLVQSMIPIMLGLFEEKYLDLLDKKARPQEARFVLPNALASTIAMTGNFRNWRHFMLMRTTKESHPDMRRVTIPLLETFKQRVPLLFDDIEPEARQIDNMRKPR